MANDTTLTLVGNLTADPELRFTPNGKPVANFTVASTPSRYDRQSQQWQDGTPMFLSCSAWADLGQNVAESLSKGDRVIVTGYLRARNFQDRDGNNRTVFEIDVHDVAPSLRRAIARPQKTTSPSQQGNQQWQQGRQQDLDPRGNSTSPYRMAQSDGGVDPWAQGNSEEAPF
jgi:single-strand DNA-binding protein